MMADDAARIAQLEAEVRQFQNLYAAARAENAALRAKVSERDDQPAADAPGALNREAYDRLYGNGADEARLDVPPDYARALEELEYRTQQLSEALDQQAATSEILRAIAAAPTDVQPVLDAICLSAMR